MDPKTCPYFEHAQRHAERIVERHCRVSFEKRSALLDAIVRALADAWTTGHAEGERDGSGDHR